jgi:hypothetical protein
MAGFNPSEYAMVEERIAVFYERFPDGRIITCLDTEMSNTDVWVFRAAIYKDVGEQDLNAPMATGWATEFKKSGSQDFSAEVAETSAIGRALANIGLTGNKKRASLEEMRKVPTDYIKAASEETDVDRLRLLWQQAKSNNAPDDVLRAVKQRAEELAGDAGVSEGSAGGVHGGGDSQE